MALRQSIADLEPGDWLFAIHQSDGTIEVTEDPTRATYLWFQSPLGEIGCLAVRGRIAYQWNESVDAPTVRPSISHATGDEATSWHGWLTDGVFSPAEPSHQPKDRYK